MGAVAAVAGCLGFFDLADFDDFGASGGAAAAAAVVHGPPAVLHPAQACCLLVDCWRGVSAGGLGEIRRSTVDALALADALAL